MSFLKLGGNFQDHVGAFLERLVLFRGWFEPRCGNLGPCWGHFVPFRGYLGAILDYLEPSGGDLGPGHLRAVLDRVKSGTKKTNNAVICSFKGPYAAQELMRPLKGP